MSYLFCYKINFLEVRWFMQATAAFSLLPDAKYIRRLRPSSFGIWMKPVGGSIHSNLLDRMESNIFCFHLLTLFYLLTRRINLSLLFFYRSVSANFSSELSNRMTTPLPQPHFTRRSYVHHFFIQTLYTS